MNNRFYIPKKKELPSIIKYEVYPVPNTEKVILETKRPVKKYNPEIIYRLETKELISGLSADFYEELKEYFVLEINKEYSRSIRRLIPPTARNIIPLIIHTRRIEYVDFKLKIFDADFSSVSSLINFTFISVDENMNYDYKFIFKRVDGEVSIKINYD